MPATINPIRKARLKKELLNPKNSIKDALLKSGYEPTTAKNSGNVKAVKICYQEINQEIQLADLTPEHFTKKSETLFQKAISLKKPDLTNANRTMEFQGRLAGVDKSPTTVVNLFETDTLSVSADALTALARRR